MSLVAPSRFLVKNGTVECHNAVGAKKPREVYLFNDMLVIAKPDGDKYKLLNMAAFDAIYVNEMQGEEPIKEFLIEIVHVGHATVVMVYDTAVSRDTWINIIKSTVSDWTAQKNRINQANGIITNFRSQNDDEDMTPTSTVPAMPRFLKQKSASTTPTSHSEANLASSTSKVNLQINVPKDHIPPIEFPKSDIIEHSRSATSPDVPPRPIRLPSLNSYIGLQSHQKVVPVRPPKRIPPAIPPKAGINLELSGSERSEGSGREESFDMFSKTKLSTFSIDKHLSFSSVMESQGSIGDRSNAGSQSSFKSRYNLINAEPYMNPNPSYPAKPR